MTELLRIGKLRFIVRTERGARHHRPHVHVIKAECEAIFSLDLGVDCLGFVNFSESDIKKIRKIILEYQKLFLEEWGILNEKE